MEPDSYGRSTVRNIYFDTDDYRLIRHSIEKPTYKEKLRIRSYGEAEADGPVFVELKKKYKGVVYKRRIAMTESDALGWICGGGQGPDTQMGREIDYFLRFYPGLHPTVALSYDREAYFSRDRSDFRVTFDDNILCRTEGLTLKDGVWGEPILEGGTVLMEIKTAGGIPLWLTHALARERIYKIPFSKYGTAYKNLIFPDLKRSAV